MDGNMNNTMNSLNNENLSTMLVSSNKPYQQFQTENQNKSEIETKNFEINPEPIKSCIESSEKSTPTKKKIMTPDTADGKNTKYYSIHESTGSGRKAKYLNTYSSVNGDNSPLVYNQFNGLDSQDRIDGVNSGDPNQRRELFIMTIDIGDGNQDNLYVYENDDPYLVAKNFCAKHNIDDNVIYPLSQNIYSNMEEVLKERAEISDGKRSEKENSPIKNYQAKNIINQNSFKKVIEEKNNSVNVISKETNTEKQLSMLNNQVNQHKISSKNENNNKSRKHNFFNELKSNNLHNEFAAASTSSTTNQSSKRHSKSPRHENIQNKLKLNSKTKDQNKIIELDQHSIYLLALKSNKTFSANNNGYLKAKQFHTISTSSPKLISNNGFKSGKSSASKSRLSKTNSREKNIDDINNIINYSITIVKDKHNHDNHELTFTPAINPVSQMIIENNKNENFKIPVYERLHKHAKSISGKLNINKDRITEISPKQTTLSGSKSSKNADINYGLLLYQKGIKLLENKNQAINKMKQQKLELEKSECTFHPILNHMSSGMSTSKSKNEHHEEQLMNYGKLTKEKIERARTLKEMEELERYSFKPTINSISYKMAERRQIKGRSPFENLYKDYKARTSHQKELAKLMHSDECPFTPSINNFQMPSSELEAFEDRNIKFIEKLEKMKEIKKIQKEEEELKDSQTGKHFFHPTICRSPKSNNRNQEGLPIGHYLYNIQNQIMHRQHEEKNREEKSLESMKIRSTRKSNAIMKQIKKKRLIELFHTFDSDGDGLISSNRIDKSVIDKNTLSLFVPLFYEMKEFDRTLSLQEFLDASERHLKSFSVDEKTRFFLPKKKHLDDSDHDFKFKPKINKKSARIANNLRPYGDSSLYDIYLQERKEFFEKLNITKENMKQDELKECTFQPKILSTSPSILSLYSTQQRQ